MKVSCIYLGILSNHESAQEKFILLSEGPLLFGTVLYHKELALNYYETEDVVVIAAGIIPKTNLADLETWGWKSSGYGVVTESNLRKDIAELIIDIKNKEL